MDTLQAIKSQKILNALETNVNSFKELLETVEDDLTEQNILRSIILFSCSGIDAIVKQLVLEALEPVIERDEGAQEQFRKYTAKKLKNNSGLNYELMAELITAKNSRKILIELLKKDLTFGSLQSSEQLYKVASYFNIKTSSLIDEKNKAILREAFSTRNVIVHQMDVDFENNTIDYCLHSLEEVDKYYKAIVEFARSFIDEINHVMERSVTADYEPLFTFEDAALLLQSI